jgi:hypothetical protein
VNSERLLFLFIYAPAQVRQSVKPSSELPPLPS